METIRFYIVQTQSDHHQLVFRALADPTRRAILEQLHTGPLAIAPLVDAFEMSRPAVAKHLRILEEATLIRVVEKGRERINHLNHQQLGLVMSWLSYFDTYWDKKLDQLQQAVEVLND